MMPTPKSCPKCCGIMEENDTSVVLEGRETMKAMTTGVVAYCCRSCGFMEFWKA